MSWIPRLYVQKPKTPLGDKICDYKHNGNYSVNARLCLVESLHCRTNLQVTEFVRIYYRIKNMIIINDVLEEVEWNRHLTTLQAPQLPDPWNETFEATQEGSNCPQIGLMSQMKEGDENCLFLNIFTNKVTNSNRILKMTTERKLSMNHYAT